jgi:tRNA nucleotidyltransferase/poly(A) polymerase
LAASWHRRLIVLGKKGKAVFRIVKPPLTFDIVPFSGAALDDDLANRDFTVNALAYDLASAQIIDLFDGRQDLAARKIRLVSERAFRDDPLRLLRAYRLGAALGFEIEAGTRAAIRRDAHLITASATERIQAELIKLFATAHSHVYIEQLAADGLLWEIVPELQNLKGCVQNHYHEFDVWEHTLHAYGQLEILLNNLETRLPHIGADLRSHLDDDKTAYLKWAILLHDVGKPASKTVTPQGAIHFYGHGQKSADQAHVINCRLKFSTRTVKYLDFIIRNHLRALFLFIASQKEGLKNKGLMRFFRKCDPLTPDLLLHTMADILGKGRTSTPRDEAFIVFAQELLRIYFEEYKTAAALPPLLSGRDLIRKLGLPPSPLFKLILKRVDEARLNGHIRTKAEALVLARKIVRAHP